MKNVLLLGGNGYIGSRLKQILDGEHCVTSLDIGWFGRPTDSITQDYRTLDADSLARFDVIIVLAGHSSVKSCEGPIQSPWLNNVTNFVDLLEKTNNQLIIYASSASVYGNSLPGKPHTENLKTFKPVNNYDVTKFVLDQHAELALLRGRSIIGLRFGTVNGWSPNLRTDLMINSMYESAIRSAAIQISNSHISRGILGLEDLCRAISCCINDPVPGIYNLASFNLTVNEIANTVVDKLDVKIIDNGLVGNAYDFSLDTTLFETTYAFKFLDTPKTILEGLINKYQMAKSQKRDQYIYYDWTEHHGID